MGAFLEVYAASIFRGHHVPLKCQHCPQPHNVMTQETIKISTKDSTSTKCSMPIALYFHSVQIFAFVPYVILIMLICQSKSTKSTTKHRTVSLPLMFLLFEQDHIFNKDFLNFYCLLIVLWISCYKIYTYLQTEVHISISSRYKQLHTCFSLTGLYFCHSTVPTKLFTPQ
jgi:hypothetical protein